LPPDGTVRQAHVHTFRWLLDLDGPQTNSAETLAVLAVFVSAAGIGFTLSVAGGVPLTVALLVGAIVATTDPAAVVGIFRDLGVPVRLVRLVEGESLLNDAAAIVLFAALLKIIADGTQPSLAASALQFAISFGGGLLLGFIGGRLFGALVSFLGGAKLAEATLALALPYVVYLAGEGLFDVCPVLWRWSAPALPPGCLDGRG
jgi:CPA1 family monovalent cation:H+ antiporter